MCFTQNIHRAAFVIKTSETRSDQILSICFNQQHSVAPACPQQ
jgi:hypothetical protein